MRLLLPQTDRHLRVLADGGCGVRMDPREAAGGPHVRLDRVRVQHSSGG